MFSIAWRGCSRRMSMMVMSYLLLLHLLRGFETLSRLVTHAAHFDTVCVDMWVSVRALLFLGLHRIKVSMRIVVLNQLVLVSVGELLLLLRVNLIIVNSTIRLLWLWLKLLGLYPYIGIGLWVEHVHSLILILLLFIMVVIHYLLLRVSLARFDSVIRLYLISWLSHSICRQLLLRNSIDIDLLLLIFIIALLYPDIIKVLILNIAISSLRGILR